MGALKGHSVSFSHEDHLIVFSEKQQYCAEVVLQRCRTHFVLTGQDMTEFTLFVNAMF